MEDWLVSLQKTVPLLQQAGSVEEIKKGHSADRKYRVELATGGPAVLRVASYEQAGQKEQEYARLQALQPLPIKASRPLDFGVRKEWGICYMLVSYIEGEDARDALPTFTDSEQQQVGFLAGRDLAAMHQLAAPASTSPWAERCVQKHRMYAAAYAASASTFKDGGRILAFIDRHLPLLAGRPNCFLHDDFHVGNLIVRDRSYAGVIDFNRYDWGDPVHEFVKLAFFSKEVSVPFCNGQLAGYWNGQEIPDSFWTLYNVYTAMAIFSSIIWTERTVPALLPDMMKRIQTIVEEHDAFERRIPSWYS
ncbi:aminoglycoside phosphotransferase family protein [Brevibacillus agri]|uniref:phosphotransferase family protein n=1 Tax=Brevibacillus agri TaxID=51101 RepID=UPI003D1F54FF